MEEKISSGQLMAKCALRLMFYIGLRFLPSSFNAPIFQQLALTSVILLREETGREQTEQRNEEHKTVN